MTPSGRGKVAHRAPAAARAAPSGGRPTAPIVRCRGPRSVGVDPRSQRDATGPSTRPEEPVPDIRPFRALRYDLETVGDPAGSSRRPTTSSARTCTGRCSRATRGTRCGSTCRRASRGEDPDERYRRAARTLTAWRSDGTLRKDPRPSVYVYEQAYRVPGHRHRADAARLLRPAADRAVRARDRRCSRTSGRCRGPRRTATGSCGRRASTPRPWSPLRGPRRAAAAAPWPRSRRGPRDRRHRRRRRPPPPVGRARRGRGIAGGRPVAAAGRRARLHRGRPPPLRDRGPLPGRAAHGLDREQDPAFDFLLMLFLDAADELTVLPTHRVVRGRGRGRVRAAARRPASAVRGDAVDAGRAGRPLRGRRRAGRAATAGSACVTRDGALLLEARRGGVRRAPGTGGGAARALDVSAPGVALETLLGIDAAAVAGGERITYTKSAAEAAALVARGHGRRRRRVPARAHARSRRSSRSPATAT